MKSQLILVFILAAFSNNVLANRSCEIIVHEKTPDCYVKQGKDGCLDIGNTKPECNAKGECVVKMPGCDKTTKY